MRGAALKADRYQLDYINLCTSIKLRFKLRTVGGTEVKPLKKKFYMAAHLQICNDLYDAVHIG